MMLVVSTLGQRVSPASTPRHATPSLVNPNPTRAALCLQVRSLVPSSLRTPLPRAPGKCSPDSLARTKAEAEAGPRHQDTTPLTLYDRRLVAPQRGLVPPHGLTIAVRVLGVAIPAVHRFIPPRVHCGVVGRLPMASAGRQEAGGYTTPHSCCVSCVVSCVVWCGAVWCGVVWVVFWCVAGS